jgi:hypothetical protein
MVSCAQSLHGFVETSFFVVDDEGAFEGDTVAVVVADRFETAVLVDDITKIRSSPSQSLLFGPRVSQSQIQSRSKLSLHT